MILGESSLTNQPKANPCEPHNHEKVKKAPKSWKQGLGSTQSLAEKRPSAEKETLHSYIKDLRTFVRTPKPGRKLSLKIRGEKVEIENVVVPSPQSRTSGIARKYSRAGQKDAKSNERKDDSAPSIKHRLSSNVDKVDELTKSIFKDYKICDKDVKMVEIDFL